MINEKECREALEHIKTLRGSNYGVYYSGFNNSALPFDEDTNVISKLIEEHFDNPPLKYSFFEESLDINLVFDKKFQAWRLAVGLTYGKEEIHFLNFGDKEVEVIPYEPNRFYRRKI